MAIKAVRIFYRKSDNQIVWTHTLMGLGIFPTTIKADLAEIPNKVISRELDDKLNIVSETKIGGSVEDYACIEEQDPQRAKDFLASDENTIAGRKLVIGVKRVSPSPIPKRDLATEVDEIKAKLKEAGILGG